MTNSLSLNISKMCQPIPPNTSSFLSCSANKRVRNHRKVPGTQGQICLNSFDGIMREATNECPNLSSVPCPLVVIEATRQSGIIHGVNLALVEMGHLGF